MKSIITPYLNMGLHDEVRKREDLKAKARFKYRAALSMPRKKKKKAKKYAMLLYSIACWEPNF